MCKQVRNGIKIALDSSKRWVPAQRDPSYRVSCYDFSVASPDPVTREFLDMLAGGPPAPALQEMSPADAREMAAGMRAVFPDTVAAPPVEIEHHLIPGGPTGDLTIQIVRPPGIPGPL